MELVYILSPARSGSTFLQMMLATHPQVVGIGEVSHVLSEYCQTETPENPAHGGRCSCGEKPEACPFWGPVLADLSGLSMPAGFQRVLDRAAQVFPDKVLVDSSKSGDFLDDYYVAYIGSGAKPRIRLRILYLVRDFRGWAMSIKRHRSRTGEDSLWNSSIVFNSYRWLYTSVRWLHKIKQYCVPFLPVYYEHLVFDTENQIRRIHDFLDLPYLSKATLSQASAHELYGSAPMRSDPQKLTRIVYDAEWMRNNRFLFAAPLLALPAIFNSIYAKQISCAEHRA